MATTVSMDREGRVTLPQRLIEKLGWQDGLRLHVSVEDCEIVLRPAISAEGFAAEVSTADKAP